MAACMDGGFARVDASAAADRLEVMDRGLALCGGGGGMM
ncbi:hypothetical protein ACP4OV_030490 [Aristida adscensionis]